MNHESFVCQNKCTLRYSHEFGTIRQSQMRLSWIHLYNIIVNLIISRKSFVYVNTKRFWTLTPRPTKIAEFIIGGHNVHSCTRFLRSNLNLVCCWWAYCSMWFSRAKVMYNSMISSTWYVAGWSVFNTTIECLVSASCWRTTYLLLQ